LKSIILMEIMQMMNHPIKLLFTDTATMKGIPNHVKSGYMLLVSITNDHTLKSRMMGNYHVRFGSGGGGSNPFANHNHHERSRRAAKAQGKPGEVLLTPAMASGLTDHIWSLAELLSYRVAPAPWVAPKRRGRPAKKTALHGRKQQSPGEHSRPRPLLRLRKGVLCSTTS
jgi:hypothetical protein